MKHGIISSSNFMAATIQRFHGCNYPRISFSCWKQKWVEWLVNCSKNIQFLIHIEWAEWSVNSFFNPKNPNNCRKCSNQNLNIKTLINLRDHPLNDIEWMMDLYVTEIGKMEAPNLFPFTVEPHSSGISEVTGKMKKKIWKWIRRKWGKWEGRWSLLFRGPHAGCVRSSGSSPLLTPFRSNSSSNSLLSFLDSDFFSFTHDNLFVFLHLVILSSLFQSLVTLVQAFGFKSTTVVDSCTEGGMHEVRRW